MFDALDAEEVFWDEVAQRREAGYLVDDVVAKANAADLTDRDTARALTDSLADAVRSPDRGYHEPSAREDILAALPDSAPAERPADRVIEDKIHAGWLGRIAGCNLGKPVELGTYWTSDRLKSYLELAGAYPLNDYIPLLDPLPAGYELREECRENTTLGNVHGSARDDDIDYPILGLHLLERHGSALNPAHVAEAWLELLPFKQVYTAERAAYRNLVHAVALDQVASYHNPYREWIGAQIRGDIFGWTHPGDPRAAATLAYQDASLSHTENGIYGEMWAAALVSGAFVADSARDVVERSLEHVPPRSRLAEVIRDVLDQHAAGSSWDDALVRIQASYGHYSWVHTLNNAALVVAGLLWGDGDYARTVGLTVMGGWDTDSNGATTGSVAGVLLGTAGLPARFIDPLEDRTRSALFGFDNSRISDLAARTIRLALDGLA
ncbi:MAG TPA: ADP-ribosylglycohydrolase family protein [Pseudonocardia sp.]|uniref:ADP-ribosylglycohydrolase family protein n=1 Tax=Pseudonocardia sp. TaxID=60912 RepID=UPI002BFAC186|nr:ADP-ribosylglycohydrolase family protein [Pseudonocardia sp.]HTF52486.1 ADP-ribosylglycohydrolase family protein [Pseudonocardia sp.]